MKTTSILRQSKYEDDLKLKKKLIYKTVPGPSLHNLSCACLIQRKFMPKNILGLKNFGYKKEL